MWVHKSWFLEFYRVPLIHFVCTLIVILEVIASEESILMVRVHQRRYFIFPESVYFKSLFNSTVGGSWWNMVDPIHYGYTAEPPVSQHREDARIISNSLIEGINTALAFCMIIQVIPVFVPTHKLKNASVPGRSHSIYCNRATVFGGGSPSESLVEHWWIIVARIHYVPPMIHHDPRTKSGNFDQA